MYCAECGTALNRAYDDVYLKCCNGIGYWAPRAPESPFTVPHHDGHWAYINYARWPKGKKIIQPRST